MTAEERLLNQDTLSAQPLLYDKAVIVRGVFKTYGSRTSSVSVQALHDVHLTAKRGAIYGLIGPSGCGKTTLLRCILGRIDVDKGKIYSLGSTPGRPGCGIPGSKVGYMPQELALYQDFTIAETLYYFGRLQKMSSTNIKEQMNALLEFLHLPEACRLIRQLSGGQQRRVSFAIALLHKPELLILDEPTVGVDPLLREKIWEYMLEIAHNRLKTIIITTHYIEEAQQADTVGFMRNGRMLAEAPPSHLLNYFQQRSLEKIFLLLCQENQHDAGNSEPLRDSTFNHDNSLFHLPPGVDDDIDDDEMLELKSKCPKGCPDVRHWRPSFTNVLALFIKNINVYKRNIGFLMFEFLLPSLQIIMFCLCIGGTPQYLPMAVVNMEANESCATSQLSCDFLNHVDPKIIQQIHFHHRFDDAKESVRAGDSWGVIYVPQNFTPSLISRFQAPFLVTNETIDEGSIHLHLDMTNQQISLTIQMQVLQAFQVFSREILLGFHLNEHLADIPVITEEPIYGNLNPTFTDFMAPGVIISISFFMATGLTALAFVLERKQGLMDRSFTAGVSTMEMMMGHILAQFIIMAGQVALLLFFAIFVFKISHQGPIWLVVLLTLLQGLTGMSLGLLISTICTEETSAIMASLGSVYPNLLLSGIIWPLEAMPNWLHYISYGLPMTYAAEAMRCILGRGWGLTHLAVYRGMLTSIGWGWALMALSALVLKIRRD